MKKAIVDEYKTIYPRTLWVTKNCTIDELRKQFEYTDGYQLPLADDLKDRSVTYGEVMDRKTGKIGVIVNIDKRKDSLLNKMATVVHEAEHAKIDIYNAIGMSDAYGKASEASAYFMQWIVECILKTTKLVK